MYFWPLAPLPLSIEHRRVPLRALRRRASRTAAAPPSEEIEGHPEAGRVNDPGGSTLSPSGKATAGYNSNSVWTPEEVKRRIDESWRPLPRWLQVRRASVTWDPFPLIEWGLRGGMRCRWAAAALAAGPPWLRVL